MTDRAEEEKELRGLAASSALELASTAYLVPTPDVDVSGDIEDMTLDYALDVLGFLEALQSATRTVRKQLETFIAAKLEGVQYYRHRDQIIRVGRGGTWKVTNPKGLAEWINLYDAWEVVNLAAPGAVTKTRLEQYVTEDGFSASVNGVVDTFMERVPSGGPITPLRLTDAPKKAQALSHGESIAAKPRLEAGE